MTFTAALDETATDPNEIVLDLRQRADGTITQQVFGLEPYIIIRPTVAEDTGLFQVGVEAGGGAELDTVGEFLEVIAEALQSDVTQKAIAATVAAKAAEDD